MEVKPGYKQTEVGVVPEEWEAGVLAYAIEELEAGTSVNSEKEERPDFYSDPCVLKTGAAKGGALDLHECKKVAQRDLWRLKVALRKDTILISRMNTVELVGESGYVGADYPNLFVPDRLWMATLRSTVHPLWLSYALIWQPVKSQISASATGTSGSMKNVSKPSLRAVKVPYPPLPEQRAIATVLSDVDGLLSGLDRLIAKKRDLKQAAMQQLLTGQTRLPGFHGEWEVKRLGEIADIKTGPFGSSLHESDYVQDGTPIITVEHLGEFGVEYRNLPMVSDHDRQRLRGYSLEVGDIVFSRVGSVDRNALIRPWEAGWLFSGRLLRVRPDRDKGFAQFLSYQFHGEAFKGLVRSVAVGQTMACLNTQILKGIIVKLPSVPEQTAIAEVLSDMDAELAALEQRREKTRALKQAMMQELLTGRTRLL